MRSARTDYPTLGRLGEFYFHPNLDKQSTAALDEIDRLRAWVARQAELEAIRQTVDCPTREGTRALHRHSVANGVLLAVENCPDCEDGKIPMARLLAVGAAVFATPLSERTWDEYYEGQNDLLDHLQAVVS